MLDYPQKEVKVVTDLYRIDGVNVAAGDDFSALAGQVCHDSFNNSPYVRVRDLSNGYFRGVRSFRFHHLPRGYEFDMASDGNGTKPVLSAAAEMYRQAAYDLLAMCGMDLTRNGGMGLIFNNVLDVSSLGEPGTEVNDAFIELITGLGEAAKKLNVVLFRGETAELGVCINSENPKAGVKFSWSGSMLGVYDKRRMITGNTLAPGMCVIALRERGFRANGISSVRKALAMCFGPEWWNNPEAEKYIRMAAEPSVLYDLLFHRLNGWYYDDFSRPITVHSIVHLSGGAFEGKLGHDILFPRGLSADLDDLWEPPEIMRLCADWRGMDDEGAYKTWNGGQGALAVVWPGEASFFVKEAKKQGIEANICGKIEKRDQPRIRIQSGFTSGREIIYRPKVA